MSFPSRIFGQNALKDVPTSLKTLRKPQTPANGHVGHTKRTATPKTAFFKLGRKGAPKHRGHLKDRRT